MTTQTEPARSRAEVEALIRPNTALIGFVLKRLNRYPRVAALDWDEVQSVGLAALWRAARYWQEDGPANFSTFAIACIRNALLSRARRKARVIDRHSLSLDGLDFELAGPSPEKEGWVVPEDVAATLPLLPERDREILRELYGEGLSGLDLATRYGVSPQAISARRLAALGRLKDLLLARMEGIPSRSADGSGSLAPPARPDTSKRHRKCP